MATAGSSERPACPPCPTASRYPLKSGAGLLPSPPEHEDKFSACVEGQNDCSPPSGHPGHPSPTQRHICSGERLHRRSDPERSSTRPARKDCDSRRGLVSKCDILSSSTGKHKLLLEDRDEMKRRNLPCSADEEPGVLSDSENEEPIRWRIQNVSAFIRKSKAWSGFSGSQRSQSCTNATEDQGCRWKSATQLTPLDQAAVGHSYAAGILLSSENSGFASALAAAPDRRLTWRAALGSSVTPLALSLPKPERSISPESNDSISEEFNHFKPIVCSPCTPPKRLPDGRLMEPTIVKSTPRNLTRGLQKATSYEASPAVLQKWRQIEVDRQNIRLNSKATLTSPGIDVSSSACQPATARCGDGAPAGNKRKLTFEAPAADSESLQKQSVKIQVPALHYSEASLRAGSDFESKGGVPGTSGTFLMFARKQSPYSRNHSCHSCKLVPKDSQSPWKQSSGRRHQSTSQRGRKREQKTKHLDPDQDFDVKRSRPVGQDTRDEHYISRVQLERRDRALAMKLQRQFDLDNVLGRSSTDTYCLRSWMSNQNRRRYSLRSSRRLNQKL